MIKCPHCSSVVPVSIVRMPVLAQKASDPERLKYLVSLLATLDKKCRKCHEVIPLDFLKQRLVHDVLICEGARSMSALNPRRLNSDTGKKAADKRWGNSGDEQYTEEKVAKRRSAVTPLPINTESNNGKHTALDQPSKPAPRNRKTTST